MWTKVKTDREISDMRQSGRMLATILEYLEKELAVGMSTKDIAILAASELTKLGGKSAFLGYQGFPEVICISLNDEVVHGIPRKDKIIKNGDILSLDFGVVYNGMITDSAKTVVVGTSNNSSVDKFISITESAMYEGINQLKDGVRVGDIGSAIQKVLEKQHYGIVRDLVGHGVGHQLHEDPNIPNYGRSGTGPVLKQGMTIAIEPMATLGGDHVSMDDDHWTIRTKDGSLSAHFEHTILITKEGYDILSLV